jgi:large subunit ribosomal protein L10
MNRDQKEVVVKEISSELDAANAVFAVDYRGISVPQAAELRNKLRETDASFNVVKNRLAKLATNGTDASDALDEHLVGPTALTFVQGDAVVAAKTIADFIRANQVLTYKGGLMDGMALEPDQFNAIARLPGVDVLRGQLVGLAASPLTGVVRTLNQLIAGLAIQLSQVAEQGLVSGEAPAPAAEPEAEAADDTETSETDDEPDKTDETPEAAGDDAEADAGDEKENE